MYDKRATLGASADAQTGSPETLNSVNEDTRKSLLNSLNTADDLLRAVRGSQPTAAGQGESTKQPERTIFGDAKEIRTYAFELSEQLNRLRNLLS